MRSTWTRFFTAKERFFESALSWRTKLGVTVLGLIAFAHFSLSFRFSSWFWSSYFYFLLSAEGGKNSWSSSMGNSSSEGSPSDPSEFMSSFGTILEISSIIYCCFWLFPPSRSSLRISWRLMQMSAPIFFRSLIPKKNFSLFVLS